MTKLSERRTKLKIETADVVRDRGRTYREVVIEATPLVARVRLKGTRRSYDVNWSTIYELCCKIAAENARREKKAKKSS